MQETYKVEDLEDTRLDQYLSMQNEELTRTYIKRLIDESRIIVNGKIAKASYKVKLGDNIEVDIPDMEEVEILPEKLNIKVVYEDDDILVIDKDKGVVVHPGNGNTSGTLVNGLMYSHKDRLSGINGVIRPGIVHRIDKDTTGLLVIAKTDIAHKKLSELFKSHDIDRAYIAIVRGIIEKDRLKINLPIGRDSTDRKKMCVTKKNSREAVTHITVLERFRNSGMTLVEARLETGRTHQIRVHMAYIGHPVIGDDTYSNGNNEFNIKGQLLHAKELGFIHPVTNQKMLWQSKEHKEFEDVLKILRNRE